MPAMIEIKPLEDGQIDALAALWNETMTADPTTAGELERRFVFDGNVGPDGIVVAADEREPVGFCVGAAYQRPCPADIDPAGDRAWIVAIGVKPEVRRRGLGRAMVEHHIRRLVADGRRTLTVATYPLGYVIPGVDVAVYADGLAFFGAMSFKERIRPLAMENDLTKLAIGEKARELESRLHGEGVVVTPFDPQWTVRYVRFMREAMPSDWQRIAWRDLTEIRQGQVGVDRVFLAHDELRVLGYCRHEAGRFGPFGVVREAQGKGIGTVLLGKTLTAMRDAGDKRAYLLWTSDETARLYGRFGFREWRRFAVMQRTIT
jgi:GNAT superfamily N-acetyltransferase